MDELHLSDLSKAAHDQYLEKFFSSNLEIMVSDTLLLTGGTIVECRTSNDTYIREYEEWELSDGTIYDDDEIKMMLDNGEIRPTSIKLKWLVDEYLNLSPIVLSNIVEDIFDIYSVELELSDLGSDIFGLETVQIKTNSQKNSIPLGMYDDVKFISIVVVFASSMIMG